MNNNLLKKIRLFVWLQFLCLLCLSLLVSSFWGTATGSSVFFGAAVSLLVFCVFSRLVFRTPVGEFAKKIVLSFYGAELIKIVALLLLLGLFLNFGFINSKVFIISFISTEILRWLQLMFWLRREVVS